MSTESSNIVKQSKPTLGPASPKGLFNPTSPRRVFRHVTYPKRIAKKAASYLHNINALFAAYMPWMSHVHLCVYHIWALIWALSQPWRCPLWHARLWYKPVLYSLIKQHCFLLDWIKLHLASHNWRGSLAASSLGIFVLQIVDYKQ